MSVGTYGTVRAADVLPEDVGVATVNMEARADLEGRQNGLNG